MAYSAIVARIKTRPHPNADRLQLGNVLGIQVVVGEDIKNGTLGIYFPSDGVLSEQFACANDLIRRKDAQGNQAGGMFENSRRVRAMNLRGEKSDGFFAPMSYLINAGVSRATVESLTEGRQFVELDGIPICSKYETPATLRAKRRRQSAMSNFPEHFDTEQYRFNKEYIQPGSLVIITEKLHGTSQRYGNVQIRRTLTWKEKLAQFFGVQVDATAYTYVIGTRRTILSEDKGGYYGNEQFRRNAVAGITLHPDEILYFEVVGYTTNGTPIMPAHDATKMGKEFVRQWGKQIEYTYGCAPNECEIYVYRITQNGRDLSWFEVEKRCKELGLRVPPVLYMGVLTDTQDMDLWVEEYTDRASTVDPTIPHEGICIRVEDSRGVKIFKNKAHAFKVMEGIIKDSGVVDMEESS